MLICIYVNCVTQVHKHIYRISIFWTHFFFFLIEKNDCKMFQRQAYLICVCVLCFTGLCRYSVLYKLKMCDYPVLSNYTSTIFPTVFAHFIALYHILKILAIFWSPHQKKKKKSSEGSDNSIFYFIIIFLSWQNSFEVFFSKEIFLIKVRTFF